MSEACAYCQPGALEGRLIYEDGLVRSFLSNPRLTRGHSLVIPRRHVEPPAPLTAAEVAVLDETERLRALMLGSFATGVDIFQKTREQVPEGHNDVKMDHIHFHVWPSNPGDALYDPGVPWGDAENWSRLVATETEEMLEILRPPNFAEGAG